MAFLYHANFTEDMLQSHLQGHFYFTQINTGGIAKIKEQKVK